MLYNGGKTLVTGLWDAMMEGFEFLGKLIFDDNFRNEMITKAINFGTDLLDGIIENISGFGERMIKLFSDAWKSFKEYWGISSPSKLMGELGQNLLDGIINVFTFFPKMFLDIAQKAWDFITGLFSSTSLTDFGSKIIDGIMSMILFWPSKMLNIAEEAWNLFAGIFGLPKLEGFANSIIDGIYDVLTYLPNKYLEIAQMAWDTMSGYFSVDKLMSLGQAIIDGVVAGLKGLKDALLAPFSAAWDGVTSLLGIQSPSTEAADMGQHIVDGLAKGLADLMPKMIEAFDIVFNQVLTLAQNNILKIVEAFAIGLKLIADSIVNSGITDAMNSVSDSVFKLGSAVVGVFEKLSQAMIDAVKNGILAVAGVISSGMDALASASSAAADATGIGKSITSITSDIAGIITSFVMQSSGFTERGITEAMNTARFADALYNSVSRFERVATAMESATFASAANALQNFQEVVAQFNDLQDQIAHGDPINIATMLDRFFNEGLGLKGEKISVKREPVNITINLNVSMKTEDVAKVMVESSLVTKGEKYDKLIADDF